MKKVARSRPPWSAWVLALVLVSLGPWTPSGASAALPGGSLDLTTVPKYVTPLVVPAEMPRTAVKFEMGSGFIDYYEIAVRQFQQQILPAGLPVTTVWSYGSVNHAGSFNYPAFSIEARVNRPVRVKWINDLKDPGTGVFFPHILPIDQTLHWANPPQDCIDMMGPRTDCRGQEQGAYTGPVPIVTHLHGAHVDPESDGYPEAWTLPAATNIPGGYATRGTHFGQIAGAPDEPGVALYQYRNDQKATTLWFHDHSLGMTRANVYAGPAGFYLLRGGLSDLPGPIIPGPAPKRDDPPGKKYFEIPIVIQDRSFNSDGSLFYAENRAFFEGVTPADLQIPFIPEFTLGGDMSDVSPLWNPEFFGNTMVVNGKTWPVMNVEKRRYRFRLLNGSDSRVLILKLVTGDPTARPASSALPFWQIGSDGGFLPEPVKLDTLLIALAERADVIVDFSKFPVGTEVFLINEGPDEPFGGGVPGSDFEVSDPETTGQVMKFVVGPRTSPDLSFPPQFLPLPCMVSLGDATRTRRLSLNEDMSMTVCVQLDDEGNFVVPIVEVPCDPENPNVGPFGPTSARLGTLDAGRFPVPKFWMDDITENPALNSTEIWEIYNFTADAHPIHVHQVQFQVLNRQALVTDDEGITEPPARLHGPRMQPESWETGFKDTVLVYPGQLTRIKAHFDIPGLYVWHCHILSHEDNEMMRPFEVVGP
jgi:spore coat protein A, manganese oxidase